MSIHLQKIKRVSFKLLIVILLFSSCETTYHTRYNDPNYLQSDEFTSYEYEKILSHTQEETNDIPESTEDSTKNYYNTINNYTSYYDFSYAARIKRFYHPSMYYTDYYGGFFTDYYWYTYDPWYWGNSIYLSYNWKWPNHYWTGNYYPYYNSGYYSNLYYSHNHYHYNNTNKNKYRGFVGSLSSNYLNTNKPKYVNRKLSKKNDNLLEQQNNKKSHNNKKEILRTNVKNKKKNSNNSRSYENKHSTNYSPSGSNKSNYNRKSNVNSQRKRDFKRNSRKPRR